MRIIRAILIALIVIAGGIPAIAYLMLSTDWAQARLCKAGEEALERLLGTDATVESVMYAPFNRLKLRGISIADDNGEQCVKIGSIAVRAELMELVLRQRIIIDYVVVDGLEARLSRKAPGEPLNVARIIDNLKSDKPKKKQPKYNLSLNSVELLRSSFAYDVLSADTIEGRFDPNHIMVTDINLSVYLPEISDSGYGFDVHRFSLREKSGFVFDMLRADASLSPKGLRVTGLEVDLPESSIRFGDIDVSADGYSDLARAGTEIPVNISILEGSRITLSELKAFVPALAGCTKPLNLSLEAEGVVSDAEIRRFHASMPACGAELKLSGHVSGLPDMQRACADGLKAEARINGSTAAPWLEAFGVKAPPKVPAIIANAGDVKITALFDGAIAGGSAKIAATTSCGAFDIDGSFERRQEGIDFDGTARLDGLDIGALLGIADLGEATLDLQARGSAANSSVDGKLICDIDRFAYRGYEYRRVSVKCDMADGSGTAYLTANDPNLQVMMQSQFAKRADGGRTSSLVVQLVKADLAALNLWDRYPGHALKATVLSEAKWNSLDDVKGYAKLSNVQYADSAGAGLNIRRFVAEVDNSGDFGQVRVESDFINGEAEGSFNFATVPTACKEIFESVFPEYAAAPHVDAIRPTTRKNDFTFDFTVADAENVCSFFNLPVMALDPLLVSGSIDEDMRKAMVNVDAEWLLQGDKLVKDTNIAAILDGMTGGASLYATSHYPTQKGPMNIVADVEGRGGLLTTNIDWSIEREIPINGNINFDTYLTRMGDRKLKVRAEFAPGQINFGNEVWNILPSTIIYSDKYLSVRGFALDAPTQKIRIDGVASTGYDDKISVDLSGIRLIEIFETLEIDKALICGEATGRIEVSGVFSGKPDIRSTDFFVKGIGYNRCVLGDADIKIGFDNEALAFGFDASIHQPDGRMSTIKGSIAPATEELDLRFDADRVRVGFMQPFMEAFCSKIDGYATGKAHLFGTFKYIDLESDGLVADSLRMKIDFTNTWYSAANAPLTITPGHIGFKNVKIYDDQGHSAMLTGYVDHDFFKRPVFKFDVSNARNLLCYDMPEGSNPRWWGTIYGNGGANIDGRPGVVNIGVNMTTCPNSKFTFALTDAEEAVEYSFISFNDVTPKAMAEAFYDIVVESESEKRAAAKSRSEEADSPTAYNMDIQVNVTPQALVTVVMDPVGGDEIRVHGTGNIRMFYGSASDILTLNGDYELESGDYNFTLQDIIVREFKIRAGSSIRFSGDPYAATLDINAIYQTNANLSDLDESFLNDKDLNRTNVPVNAVLLVTGNMLSPDIKFDLEFPSFTNDVVSRKVHSIVSTEDMMNRQIIYLLALNRFYTPDYMASTTRGNELFSVASSTISSQLSSMLGKLSDNWSIAPNLRSNHGDFSDVEVDVNLSSRLLNNRLLFNGNFGYRDKSLNTNQFVGDFDIEYLLNRGGTLRLKAYNRYNDQNFYVRTAQTTQGVGVMVRKDFDNFLDLFKRRKKKAVAVPADTIDTNLK